jgi:predicted MFS family arabinose efflux permease
MTAIASEHDRRQRGGSPSIRRSSVEGQSERGFSGRDHARLSATLFLCLFAAQSGLIALSPVLADVAADFDVSTATAGQLRTVSGLAAGMTALALAYLARSVSLRSLLGGGALLLASGSLASAVAPSFAVLALAQVLVGTAVAILVTAGTLAAAEWAPPEYRARVLSWALIGNPGAWIIGMPLIGLLGEASWRYAWLALPLTASIAATLAVRRGPEAAPGAPAPGGLVGALTDPGVRRWAFGELLANAAWVGLLVYAGALFTESHGTSTTVTGIVLALAAAAFVAGNLASRRLVDGELRRPLMALALGMAVLVAAFGAVRPSPSVSAGLLAAAAFLGGGRTLLGNAFGLQAAPAHRLALMSARAAANQFGYFLGSAVGGLALAAAGYGGLGLALGLVFVAAAGSLMPGIRPRRAGTATTAPCVATAVRD